MDITNTVEQLWNWLIHMCTVYTIRAAWYFMWFVSGTPYVFTREPTCCMVYILHYIE